jgi:M6 family metalloprotease-like protein
MLPFKRQFVWIQCVLIFLAPIMSVRSAPMENVPVRVHQPDGVILECLASGDEYYNWLHDGEGYTIVQDPSSGFYVYALRAKGRLSPSVLVAGRVNPAASGLEKWIVDPPDVMREFRNNISASTPGPASLAPTAGTINNLVIFIRFSDEAEFTDQVTQYSAMFNNTAAGANSLVNFYKEASYNKLTINTSMFPLPAGSTVISSQDSHPRGYYQPYNASTNPIGYTGGDDGTERRDREHLLLKAAVDNVAGQIPSGLLIDGDSDGRVDNICFIISGGTTGWSSLLWPHQWSLYSQTATINGKKVWGYNLQLQASLLPSNVGVLAHEMGHTLGYPDLYHYASSALSPVGSWDVMASNSNPPQHMSAYMKFRYTKWINAIPTITSPGRYTLRPLSSPLDNCYKIPSPYSTTEYFVVEYRKKTTPFETKVPGEGLVVYRVNGAQSGSGNANGPPDELYVYRPGGTPSANGTLNNAAFCQESGRDTIDDRTNPWSSLSNGTPGGLNIVAIGVRGDTIAFTVAPPIPAVFDSLGVTAASGGGVLMSWKTLAEYRAVSFEVQRSNSVTDGYQTVPGSVMPGNGTTCMPHGYSFVDRSNAGQKFYRLKGVDSSGTAFLSGAVALAMLTEVREATIPGFMLSQNYPNPFNPSTTIRYGLPYKSVVQLNIYNALGQQVDLLVHGEQEAGYREAHFDGGNLPSGVYFYRLQAGTFVETKRLLLIR